ncbi:HTH-type transcriptional regulator MhqR [BD1-7 clade bacterium]|uniref:HTH-type transcriptional regulator MhqR n=1 Tax=BD1-7 clade bacterium TaxID=2029982 RepID=A0A5S9QFA9_9GAMM|nr:HTH-type transcriptional regulator MhqR [BD1-7 clade bacterium]CAA0117240.1 HTH-type transcriptional regulator MhqR [BD1-7 clade bacterium]CAA0125091.1 HTH-type transcriptional regulator MhqR [BD1-7 clade bacterium]
MDDKRISVNELLNQKLQNWPDSLGDSIATVLRLHRTQGLLIDLLERSLDRHGLQTAEFEVMAALRRQPPPHQLTPTDLCGALLLSSGGTTKVLQRLQRRDLIDRPTNPDDGRSCLVQLSDTGKQCIETVVEELVAIEDDAMQVLDTTEKAQLNQLLDKLLSAWGG